MSDRRSAMIEEPRRGKISPETPSGANKIACKIRLPAEFAGQRRLLAAEPCAG
jgi:hypothetical protein